MKCKRFVFLAVCTNFFLYLTVNNSFSADYKPIPKITKFGIWNVNASVDFANRVSSKFSRRMWRLSDYKQHNGQILSKKLTSNPYLNKSEVIGTMAGPLPAWIQPPDRTSSKIYPPTDWQLFDKLIRRWLHDIPDFPDYFEIFNELDAHWVGSISDYQQFQSTIAIAIKDVYPKTIILGPSSYDADLMRLKKYLSPKFIEQFDGIVLHAYVNGTRPEDEFIGRIRQVKEYLKQIGFSNKPIYITEFGWTTSSGSWQRPVDELSQAQFLTRSLLLLASEKVEAAVYFCLFYDAKNPGERGFSVLNGDMTPKPAYLAFKHLTHYLNDANSIDAGINGSTYYAIIQKPITTVLALWSPDGPKTFALPQTKIAFRLYDFMGKEIVKTSLIINVDKSPVYIEFASRLDKIRF